MSLWRQKSENDVEQLEISARELGLHNGSVCEYGGREVDDNAYDFLRVDMSIIYLMAL